MKIAFLDRDGTINKDYPEVIWHKQLKPVLLPGALNGLLKLKERDYQLVILTNQSIINEGFVEEQTFHMFHNNLMTLLCEGGLSILSTFYCPHAHWEDCNCKKPKRGMIDACLEKFPQIEMTESIMIGHSLADQLLAEDIGVRFFGINGEYFKDAYNSIYDVAQIL
jgi:D-glycero-D-manno-heptose 1,7-bisphosphate phosphatase